MIIKTIKHIPASEITQPAVFSQRRAVLKTILATALAGSDAVALADIVPELKKSKATDSQPVSLGTTAFDLVKSYTNYYEFSFNKEDGKELAQNLRIEPWSVEISGEVEQPLTFGLGDLLKQPAIQERVYRFRCVEGWSMVVPWTGFPLLELLKKVKPLSSAKFVKFTSVYQPETMPLQRKNSMLEWPYVEGLRIDEAVHPLTLLAVGVYGEHLPKQNGAPIRLVVPWKYGFKSIKAIVKIELLRRPPLTSWNKYAPGEYGFYANVNPDVPHPRWSQASERQLGSKLFTPRRKTELFNGYGAEVASLYRDMDLGHFF